MVSVKTGQGAGLLQDKRQQEQGFTLLEVTIVLVISGILAAIALPSFLNQASKAKQIEAKMYLGTLNRAQQSYILERTQFADTVNHLGIAFPSSLNYGYSIRLNSAGNQYAVHDAKSLSVSLRPYVGVVAIAQSGTGDARIEVVLCESKAAQQGKAEQPVINATSVKCASSTKPVGQ
ncbi:prepilin-type N-terminal cleavage/methylation domain-containing protein [Leptolyngbya sp. FACHB-321]|nr:prepilin-type N-terminal cleavage/methylation domain-containing protein [Leptolyngbya sp. FACHB-321]